MSLGSRDGGTYRDRDTYAFTMREQRLSPRIADSMIP